MQPLVTSLPVWIQVLLAFVPALAAAFAAVALLINSAQSKHTNAQARAAIVAEFLERFTDDQDMQEVFYSIEYSQFEYSPESFHGSAQERQLDKLLMHFSTAALAWRASLLTAEDLHPLQYLVRRVLRDPGVDQYLRFVSEWSSRANLGEHPYVALSAMAAALQA